MRIFVLFILSLVSCFALEVGSPLPLTSLSGEEGGTLDQSQWESASLTRKVHVVFYVDPDEKNTNNHVSEALKKEQFDRNVYGSVAIINMAASWLPNWALESALEEKQATYPDTLYVKDMHKKLINTWGLKDYSSNVYVIDKDGIVRFVFEGKLDSVSIQRLIETIRTYM